MDEVHSIFEQLDKWRHLPNYQLERRADIFFSVYLREVLESKFDIKIHEQLIPEFPLHKNTLYPDDKTNKSYKIDYLTLSQDLNTAFFVELKTDIGSLRDSQKNYLARARKVGLSRLLKGLITIFEATHSKRKYYHLFCLLEELGLLKIPEEIHEIVHTDCLIGVGTYIPSITIHPTKCDCRVVFIQPTGDDKDTISFAEFSEIISKHDDELTGRFRESLSIWATQEAGYNHT